MDYHKEQYKQQEKEKERAKSKVQFCCYLPVKILDKDIKTTLKSLSGRIRKFLCKILSTPPSSK